MPEADIVAVRSKSTVLLQVGSLTSAGANLAVDSAACRRTSALSTATKMRMDGVAASEAAIASNSTSATYSTCYKAQQLVVTYQTLLQFRVCAPALDPTSLKFHVAASSALDRSQDAQPPARVTVCFHKFLASAQYCSQGPTPAKASPRRWRMRGGSRPPCSAQLHPGLGQRPRRWPQLRSLPPPLASERSCSVHCYGTQCLSVPHLNWTSFFRDIHVHNALSHGIFAEIMLVCVALQ